MIVTTQIDLSPQTYRYFLHQAEQYKNKTPEDMIALFLESCIGAQLQWEEQDHTDSNSAISHKGQETGPLQY